MAAEAIFTTNYTPQGVQFNVRPARSSIALTILIVVWACFQFVACSAFAHDIRSPIPMLLWFATLCLVVYFKRRDSKKRKPVTIFANRNGLVVDGVQYPASDIAELVLTGANNVQVANSRSYAFGVAGTGLGAPVALGVTAMAAGAAGMLAVSSAVGQRQNARRLSLMLRKRSDSRPVQLVYGLTATAGDALVRDLCQAMA